MNKFKRSRLTFDLSIYHVKTPYKKLAKINAKYFGHMKSFHGSFSHYSHLICLT